MTTIGPQTATCTVCSQQIKIVNYHPATSRRPWEGGYLARHWRPGLRRGYTCRGWKTGWVPGTVSVGAAA